MNPSLEHALDKTVELVKTGAEAGFYRAPALPAFEADELKQAPANVHPSIVAFREPDSFAGEQYRKLKTAVIRMTREGSRNLLMVTSALSGEGKSVTCANLAIMLARDYGKTVLLVDADLRHPSLHEYLGMKGGAGLTDILEDNMGPEQAIVRSGIPKLSFLAAGKRAADPAELLSSPRLQEFLAEAKNRYADRYVILDTSPALLFAEAAVISTLVDGVLAVVKEGAATAKSVRQMLDLLNPSAVIGIVYNDARSANQDAKHQEYYRKNCQSNTGKAGQQTMNKRRTFLGLSR